MEKLLDGLHLVYVKDRKMYPVILTKDQWDSLQFMANVISNPIKVLEKPLGVAYNIADDLSKKENPMESVKTSDITTICK